MDQNADVVAFVNSKYTTQLRLRTCFRTEESEIRDRAVCCGIVPLKEVFFANAQFDWKADW
jgi:hypothetical protein